MSSAAGRNISSPEKSSLIHPGIVLGSNGDNTYRVAMISNKLLGNGRRLPASNYAPDVAGDISLETPATVSGTHLKRWTVRKAGQPEVAVPRVTAAKLAQLVKDMSDTSVGVFCEPGSSSVTTRALGGKKTTCVRKAGKKGSAVAKKGNPPPKTGPSQRRAKPNTRRPAIRSTMKPRGRK
ncbi:hypothetical protein FA15DRAFT_468517 [Coprinopsis marcescibilis]|uniref:Uncharacterized protein n=1 Tax=Coprinopsis marcescibilis TaxID=230819 RepID=A0A5C3KSX0_COPMA|nr:hypothetical protein FA15DRAFT_468517 [Coprinopsis marcescibilis]